MEKFYIINNEEFLENRKKYINFENKVRDNYKNISKEFGIESDRFGADKEILTIAPTDNDRVEFANQLRAYSDTFKKNSKIGRQWIKLNEGLMRMRKPRISDYIHWEVRCSYIAFEHEGKTYGHIQSPVIIGDASEGFVEIKGSEFYDAKEEFMEGIQKGDCNE